VSPLRPPSGHGLGTTTKLGREARAGHAPRQGRQHGQAVGSARHPRRLSRQQPRTARRRRGRSTRHRFDFPESVRVTLSSPSVPRPASRSRPRCGERRNGRQTRTPIGFTRRQYFLFLPGGSALANLLHRLAKPRPAGPEPVGAIQTLLGRLVVIRPRQPSCGASTTAARTLSGSSRGC
jgi:hypothetical protein